MLKRLGSASIIFACIMGLELWTLSSLCKSLLGIWTTFYCIDALLLCGVDDDNCTIVLDGKFRVAG